MKPTILFMGTPEFARVSLQSLFEAGYPIVAAYVQPDKPSGRGQALTSPPCALYAKEKGIPLYQPASVKEESVLTHIESLKPDFIVVAAYGKKLPDRILAAPRMDCLNVHASLLPQYRGASPINRAILNGDGETGVTIMKVVTAMDAGPVYSRVSRSITDADTAGSLTQDLAKLGSELLLQTIPQVASGTLKPVPQDESRVSLAPMLKKEDGCIHWSNPAAKILRQIRGCDPWPSAYTFIDGKRVKIYDARVSDHPTLGGPGEVIAVNGEGIHVAAQDGNVLVRELQLEGKKRMSAGDFLKGFKLQAGDAFHKGDT